MIYCEDSEGNSWNYVRDTDIDINDLNRYINKYYISFEVKTNILDKKNVKIKIYYERLNENYSSLLLDFEEQLFINDYPDKKIEEITDKFIKLIVDLYDIVKYDYALCDQEAVIKYTLDDIEKAKKEYSVLLIPKFNKMEIIKNSWNIDGLTDRLNSSVKYISIKYICPICGYYGLNEPAWLEDGITSSFEICPCCGTEFGYHDCKPEGKKKQYEQWVSRKYEWHFPQDKPKDWDLDKQLKNINRTRE